MTSLIDSGPHTDGAKSRIAYGPVPSRRLGRSIGINIIPPKTCSYACTYCQVGPTSRKSIERQEFYQPEAIVTAVCELLIRTRQAGDTVDVLTFVADGEPTLDLNLGREIDLLKPFGVTIGVITNASLLWRRDVRDDLGKADWVSVKVDSVVPGIWRSLNRPHRELHLEKIMEGLLAFSDDFDGRLASETMLVKDVNDDLASVNLVGDLLHEIDPGTAYLSVPIKPPADKAVRPPEEENLRRVFHLLEDRVGNVELLTGYEGDDFGLADDPVEDLLAICAVHPMREDAAKGLLAKGNMQPSELERLVREGLLTGVEFEGITYYRTR